MEEVELVSKRVKSKREEIETLKHELEKLISSGIKTKFNDDLINKENLNDATSSNNVKQRIIFKNPDELNVPSSHSVVTKSIPKSPIKKHNLNCDKILKEQPPKKVCSYDKTEAREYIKKQKEKRLKQAKSEIKNTKDVLNMRKEKLKELHQKSLQIVAKNVKQKRDRSRSRENNPKVEVNDVVTKDKIKTNQQDQTLNNNHIPDLIPDDIKINKKINDNLPHSQFENITIRSHNENNLNVIPLLNIPIIKTSNSIDNQNIKAAIKIQSFWRGYRQRQLYKSELAKKQTNFRKLQERSETNKTPNWLQPSTPVPHPYNFITTVKRKLNLALNLPQQKNTVDKDVQSSLTENHSNSNRVSEVSFQKLKNELKEALNDSVKSTKSSELKSFLSHKCLDVKTLEALKLHNSKQVNNEFSNKSDCSNSDTSKNIPDISTEDTVGIIKKITSDESDFSEYGLDKNKLKNLKLKRNSNSSNILQSFVSNNSQVNSDKSALTDDYRNCNLTKSISEHVLLKTDTKSSTKNVLKSPPSNEIKENMLLEEKLQPERISSEKDIYILSNNLNNYNEKSNNVGELNGNKSETISSFKNFTKTSNNANNETATNSIEKGNTYNISQDKNSISLSNNSHKSRFKWTKTHTSESEIKTNSQVNDNYSSAFASVSESLNSVPSLKHPSITLRSSRSSYNSSTSNDENVKSFTTKTTQNINLKSGERTVLESKSNSNQIHLKFEAQLHLLNDYNEQFKNIAINKPSVDIPNVNVRNTVVVQNKDTQTSLQTLTETKHTEKQLSIKSKSTEEQISTINYSRGSKIEEEFNLSTLSNISDTNLTENMSLMQNTLNNTTIDENNEENSFRNEDLMKDPYLKLSVNVYEQLIKDEDVRMQNLETVLKIREKTLLDKTKGELTFLEIKKRYLKEAGQLHEVSSVIKRQRGVIIKLQHEQHEMQKLKQMQKAASKERKINLKKQYNMIKEQLSTNSMLGKIKINSSRERRNSGPLKVYKIQNQSESIKSEISISRKNSVNEDVLSVTSNSTINRVAEFEISDSNSEVKNIIEPKNSTYATEFAKKALLMRGASLQKRRKAAEQLLKWHQKLLEEEKKVTELEMAASSIINQVPTVTTCTEIQESSNAKQKFSGIQLNLLWFNMTGCEEKHFDDKQIYSMSQINWQKFYKRAERRANETKRLINVSGRLSEKSFNNKADSNKLSESSENIKTESIDSVKKSVVSTQNSAKLESNKFNQNEFLSSVESALPKTLSNNISSINYTSKFESYNKKSDAEISTLPSDLKYPSSTCNENSTIYNSYRVENLNSPILESIESLKQSIQEITRSPKYLSSRSNRESQKQIISTSIASELDNSKKNKCDSEDIIVANVKNKTLNHVISDNTIPHHRNEKIESENDEKQVLSNSFELSLQETSAEEDLPMDEECVSPEKGSDSIEDKVITEISAVEIAEDENIIQENISSSNSIELNETTNVEQKLSSDSNLDVSVKSIIEADVSVEEKSNSEKIQEQKNEELIPEIEDETENTTSSINLQTNCEPLKSDIKEITVENNLEDKSDIQLSKTSFNTESNLETSVTEKTQPLLDLSYGFVSSKKKNDEELSTDNLEECTDNENSEKNTSNDLDKSLESEAIKSEDGNDNVSLASDGEANEVIQTESVTEISKTDSSKKSQISVATKSELSVNESPKAQVDVKKRVSEILADAHNTSRGDKSPRLQDLYVTTYDVISPSDSPELGSPKENEKSLFSAKIFGNEAEELLKKQLAIEQEIKQLEQQQKEQIPYLFMREIPNKPPPPYTPPVTVQTPLPKSVLPTDVEDVKIIISSVVQIIHESYLNGTLNTIKFSDQKVKKMLNNSDKYDISSYEFIFDLCKEIAVDHYKQFDKESGPVWMHLTKRQKLATSKPLDRVGLEEVLYKKVEELLEFRKVEQKESAIIKWSRKKRDHVDEILVLESQTEETEWTNYDKDEVIVKNDVTNGIMNMLLTETTQIFDKILKKKQSSFL